MAFEGLGLDVDGLGHVAAALNLVVHGHQHAFAHGVLAAGHGDGAVQVQRAIGRQGGAGAHRAYHHDRLVGVHRQAEEIGRFFQRVGTVGDDDAVHVGALGQGRNVLAQLQQLRVGEAF